MQHQLFDGVALGTRPSTKRPMNDLMAACVRDGLVSSSSLAVGDAWDGRLAADGEDGLAVGPAHRVPRDRGLNGSIPCPLNRPGPTRRSPRERLGSRVRAAALLETAPRLREGHAVKASTWPAAA